MDRIYINNLYDYYQNLLTTKQQQYFEDYYFNNLTLSEISDNYGISRNAIHKQIKDVENKLNDYEDKLKLYYKQQKLKEVIIKINDENIKQQIEELI